MVCDGVRRIVHVLIGPRGGGRDHAVSDLPAGAEVLTGHIGRGVPGLTVTGVVREQRPAVVGRGRKQEGADSWLPTGPMKDRTFTLPQEAKTRNTIHRSRHTTAGRPDAVGM
jgi:hypothetical protein